MVKVSVIVPVYNGQKYLHKCLDSICAQTLRDIEIIVVDDGSTDSTPEILQEYAAVDSRFQILHQQNQYCGVARNNGMAKASGQYLIFWDADDFFAPEALESMYDQISRQQADICVCGGAYFDDRSGKIIPNHTILDMSMVPENTPVFNAGTNPDYILNFGRVEVWNKMFRRGFLEEMHLRFQPVRNVEDVWFVEHALCEAERVTCVDKSLIFYRINQSTNQLAALSGEVELAIGIWVETAEDLRSRGILPERSFGNRAAKTVLYMLQRTADFQTFVRIVKYLQKEGLDCLGLREREKDFYYQPEHFELMLHLRNDTPQEFLMYLCNRNYLWMTEYGRQKRHVTEKNRVLREKNRVLREKNSQLKQERNTAGKELKGIQKKLKSAQKVIKTLQNEKKMIRNSPEYKVGSALLKVPRKVKSTMSRKKILPAKNKVSGVSSCRKNSGR